MRDDSSKAFTSAEKKQALGKSRGVSFRPSARRRGNAANKSSEGIKMNGITITYLLGVQPALCVQAV